MNFDLLTPLGLLGLLAIAVLILIYLLKPNYQQKVISSTFVWKLSLKYRKKRLPINRFRDILLIICQILILALCAMILAQPFTSEDAPPQRNEKLLIIDASANMLVSHRENTEETTRFDRALERVKSAAADATSQGVTVTVLVAGETPTFLMRNIGSNDLIELEEKLGELKCTYGTGDIDGAIVLAKEMLETNPEIEVELYTATSYADNGGVTIVDVSAEGEWNVGILNATAVTEENNCYSFSVDVAAYGRDVELDLYCDVFGVNADDVPVEGGAQESQTVTLVHRIRLVDGVTENVVFNAYEEQDRYINSYEYVRVHVEIADGLSNDNDYYLYDGKRDAFRIQYYSTLPSSFFNVYFNALRRHTKDYYNLEIKEVRAGDTLESEGFDFYIYEHKMPDELPTDGAVLLVDPDKVPTGANFVISERIEGEFSLSMGQTHVITQYLDPTGVDITRYTQISGHDGYEELLYSAGSPIFLYKNTPDEKISVLAIDISYSTLSVRPDFPLMMCLLFDEYFPRTVDKHVFEVGETATFKARTALLNVDGAGKSDSYDEFPAEFKFVTPGVYTLTQPRVGRDTIVDNVYVKIPSIESNIMQVRDKLDNPHPDQNTGSQPYDLLLWFAIALVTLLFAEWLLQLREHF